MKTEVLEQVKSLTDSLKGYKQTEVGLIPDDWEIMTLKEVATYRRGSFPQPYGLDKWYDDINGFPFVQVFDVDDNKLLKSETKRKISVAAQKMSVFAKKGSIVLTIQGSIGRLAITQYDSYIDRTLLLFESFLIKFDPYYFATIISLLFQKEKENAPGGIIKTITKEALSSFLISFPKLSEQTAIATALSDADALIRSLVQLIEKKKNIKQGAMQELLTGKVRLPGFEIQQGLKNTEIGPISTDWDLKLLGDCLMKSPDYGINAAAVNYNSDLPTYLRITDISDEGKFVSMNKVSVDNLYSRNYYLEDDDIVFARTGASVGKSYLYNIKDGLLVFAGFLIRIKLNSHILIPRFLKYFSQTPVFWNWVLTNSMRSGQPGINSSELKSLLIKMPNSVKEQKAICDILDSMDEEISILQLKLNKYNCIKQGMMQNLLTGKIRLI